VSPIPETHSSQPALRATAANADRPGGKGFFFSFLAQCKFNITF